MCASLPTVCTAFNQHISSSRQVLQFKHQGNLSIAFGEEDCRFLLGRSACPYMSGGMNDLSADGEVLPTKLLGVGEMVSKIKY